MEALKDIKGWETIPDNSFDQLLLTLGGVALGVVLIIALIIWLRRPQRKRRKITPEMWAKEQLSRLNFDDTKEAVYTFSEAIQILAPEHPQIEPMLQQLEKYKYKREVPPLTPEDRQAMQTMIEEITHDQ